MSRKIGRVLIFLGILLLVCAGGTIVYQAQLEKEAGVQSAMALQELSIWNERMEALESGMTGETSLSYGEDPVTEIPDYLLRPNMDMPEEVVDGVAYIGVLEIPELQLALPVISNTTNALLKKAPCRYAGSAYLDDLVIGAHNYARHFGNIDDLGYGDSITFTDMDGNVFSYEVANIEVLQPNQVEDLCSGEWPLSLYTCTPGGQARVAVRCEKVL